MSTVKIGITGSSGILGKILVKKLSNKKYQNISCFNGDICLRSDIKEWLSQNKFDIIFHLAAMVSINETKNNSLLAYNINVGGTINLLSEIKDYGNKMWLFYASTCHIYKSKNTPINENDRIDPISLYGMTKFMGERICFDAEKNKNYNISTCLGRIFSFYHPTQKKPFLYPSIIDRLNKENLDEPFFLYGANSQRDISNAEDIIDITIKLMEKKFCGIINIGSGKGTKIKDFVQNFTKKELKIVTDEQKDILVADISKLNKLLSNKS